MRLILFDCDFLYHAKSNFDYRKVDYSDSVAIAILTQRNRDFEKTLERLGIEISVCTRNEIPQYLPAMLFYYLGVDSSIDEVLIYSGSPYVQPVLNIAKKFVRGAYARKSV